MRNLFQNVVSHVTDVRHHGPISDSEWLWSTLRRVFRWSLPVLPEWTVEKRIGPYGPFEMRRRYTFSDFESWGSGHNRGFEACVEAARGTSSVLDVGAHVGLVTLPLAHSIKPDGTVYAFEPARQNLPYLQSHVEWNAPDKVEIVPNLVGAEPDMAVPFYEAREPTGMQTIAPNSTGSDYNRTKRPQITLDGFCQDRNISPQVVKIDVEGAELDVLRGASHVLQDVRPLIFLSVHPNRLEELGYSVAEIQTLARKHDYKVLNPKGESVQPTRTTEYVLRPRERSYEPPMSLRT